MEFCITNYVRTLYNVISTTYHILKLSISSVDNHFAGGTSKCKYAREIPNFCDSEKHNNQPIKKWLKKYEQRLLVTSVGVYDIWIGILQTWPGKMRVQLRYYVGYFITNSFLFRCYIRFFAQRAFHIFIITKVDNTG